MEPATKHWASVIHLLEPVPPNRFIVSTVSNQIKASQNLVGFLELSSAFGTKIISDSNEPDAGVYTGSTTISKCFVANIATINLCHTQANNPSNICWLINIEAQVKGGFLDVDVAWLDLFISDISIFELAIK